MNIYKELEACFQSNVDHNFPHHQWTKDKFGQEEKDSTRMFDVCFVKQLETHLKSKNMPGLRLLRFTFPEKGAAQRRIASVEQISIRGVLFIFSPSD